MSLPNLGHVVGHVTYSPDYKSAQAAINRTNTVADYPDSELVLRVLKNLKINTRGRRRKRLAVVMDFFGLGSTYARQLCDRFGLDPDELV